MKTRILKLAARIIAGIKSKEFKEVVDEVIKQDSEKISGEEKFKSVVARIKEKHPRAIWILQTLVQLAFAYAKIKDFLPSRKTA